MTFITVIRSDTFTNGSVEVELDGIFTGNLTGNVDGATCILFALDQGIKIGNTTTSSTDNTSIAIGKGAEANSSGTIAIGQNSLNNGIGINNLAIGVNSIGIGPTTGEDNIGFGRNAGLDLTSGSDNLCIGPNALSSILTTNDNIAIGRDASKNDYSSSYTITIGANAHSTFTYNSAYGSVHDDGDVIIGHNAAASHQGFGYSGPSVIIGDDAAKNLTKFGGSVVIGHDAWRYQNFSGGYNFQYNVVIGSSAAKQGISFHNTIIGYAAFKDAGTGAVYEIYGSNNTIIGSRALQNGNTIVGCYNNTVLGKDCMNKSNGTYICKNNIAIGSSALKQTGGAQFNIAVGYHASDYSAGNQAAKINYNIVIGKNRSSSARWAIGANLTTTVQDILVIGHNSHGSAGGSSIDTTKIIHIGNNLTDPVTATRMHNVSIGHDMTITPNYSIAIGSSSSLTQGGNLIAIGYNFDVSGFRHVVIGSSSSTPSNSTDAVMIGDSIAMIGGALAASHRAVAIGASITLNSNAYNAVAIGYAVAVVAADSITIGRNAYVGNNNGIAIGGDEISLYGAKSGGDASIAIGYRSGNSGNGNDKISIGRNAMGSGTTTGINNIAIGNTAGTLISSGQNNMCLGWAAGDIITTGSQNICIGPLSDPSAASLDRCISIGQSSKSGNSSIAIGSYSIASGNNSIAIGGDVAGIGGDDNSPKATEQDQVAFGRVANTSGLSATANATVWGQVFQDRDWDDTEDKIAAINATGSIYKTTIDTSSLTDLGNLTTRCLTGTRAGSGNVTLSTSPNVPTDEVWGFSIDVVGRESSSGNIFYERQSLIAFNNAGSVEINKLSTISSLGIGSLSSDVVTVQGSGTDIDVIVTTSAAGTTNWTAKMIITTVI